MNDAEQTEYLGLAAAVGRLAVALKNSEAALADALAERDQLQALLEESSGNHSKDEEPASIRSAERRSS